MGLVPPPQTKSNTNCTCSTGLVNKMGQKSHFLKAAGWPWTAVPQSLHKHRFLPKVNLVSYCHLSWTMWDSTCSVLWKNYHRQIQACAHVKCTAPKQNPLGRVLCCSQPLLLAVLELYLHVVHILSSLPHRTVCQDNQVSCFTGGVRWQRRWGVSDWTKHVQRAGKKTEQGNNYFLNLFVKPDFFFQTSMYL